MSIVKTTEGTKRTSLKPKEMKEAESYSYILWNARTHTHKRLNMLRIFAAFFSPGNLKLRNK